MFLTIVLFAIVFSQTPDNKAAFLLFFLALFAVVSQITSLFLSEKKKVFLVSSLVTCGFVLKALSMATFLNYLLLAGIFVCFWLFSKSSK